MNILGIETSCDETAAAVVQDGVKLSSNVTVSQIDIHKEFGGVVPEVAARSHIEVILPTIEKALDDAFPTENGDLKYTDDTDKLPRSQSVECKTQTSVPDPWDQIDAIAVTNGPGLKGSLLIGTLTARTLALAKNKPLYPINHVEAHTYANFITDVDPDLNPDLSGSDLPSKVPEFPLLSLIISGGHTQLVVFTDHGDYELLGQTRDDAVGEAFDKVAGLLGLGYPGGPSIAHAAENGDAHTYSFPEAKLENSYDFSFSGLKTAVLRHLQELIGKDYSFPSFEIAPYLTQQQIDDTAASFQRVAVDTLVNKTVEAHQEYVPKTVVIAGGVAANQELRRRLREKLPVTIDYAPPQLCTDNAAMIAARGYFPSLQHQSADPHNLDVAPSLSM